MSLTRKTMLAGFWWPTLKQDSARLVQTCEGCQHHSNFSCSPPTLMKPIWASCPFDQWGMDIWVEAEPLAKITEQEVLKFLWKNIVCRFGVPRRIISDNGRQFQVFPVEIGQTSSQVESYPEDNDQSRAMELDLIEEKRNRAFIRMEAYRSRVMKSYNKKVRIRDFQVEDLVMKKVNRAGEVGKLEARWEGPYKFTRRVNSGSFYLEDTQGRPLKRPWNVFNLKKYYA
ncbi:uncharacterized protein LOC142550714 [Primulina tabacum]|uniref:uncharacterized protein LOC142550714 n=1 Tax=Primulina tabacum TaxID=48773 RepID=UPI003F5A3689